METLTTSEVAAQAGVNIETVRYYERRGLLPEPPRRASGYRQYEPEHVARIRFIKRAKELGFTLAEIADLLSMRAAPHASTAPVRQHTRAKIREIDQKIEDLQRIRATLVALMDACDETLTTRECPILHALEASADPVHIHEH